MNIVQSSQYNQGISKYKLLSSTAGVGSIITTKLGYYVLISDTNKWHFVASPQREIEKIKEDFVEEEWYEKSKKRISELGISVIDDARFVEFLKKEKELDNLLCLVGIPHLSINEFYNTVNVNNNPIIQELRDRGEKVSVKDFMVFGTHFPKWFKNRKGELKHYNEWKEIWVRKNIETRFFTPPRDANDPIKKSDGTLVKNKVKDIDGVEREINLYRELTQTNLILICSEGHLSDVPWPKFLRWKTEKLIGKRGRDDNGERLFEIEPCCPSPELKWTESTTRSEGYGSIYIECKCGFGTGKDKEHPKINLEGINNLKPFCQGHKPWEINLGDNENKVPYDSFCTDIQGRKQQMQISLVTGNNVYFANVFSSLFVPKYLAEGIDKKLFEALKKYEKKYLAFLVNEPNTTKEEFANSMITKKRLADDGFAEGLERDSKFLEKLRTIFVDGISKEVDDPYEYYRWQEYQCFKNNSINPEGSEGLVFEDIELPKHLSKFLKKIQQVEELKISHVQLDFTRIKPNERIKKDGDIINTAEGMDIYSVDKNELFVLPTNETLGEGLFFDFNEDAISNWYNANFKNLNDRLSILTENYDIHSQGASIRQKIENDGFQGAKFLLIHTFSHLIMRELEFSCGYPTASLKERLYISPRMAGVLIYTAEGSEGSMGGLVWQGQPQKIKSLIESSLERAFDCSSDPLCWESDGQGIFNLNLAACFSCSLVSETACEERNLGLDRRKLVDFKFGFFKDFIL